MKNLKRIFSTFLALALALCLAVPAFAVNITMKDKNPTTSADDGSTYKFYQLLNVTMKDGVDPTDDNKEEKGYAYTVNEKYRTILQEVTGKKDDEEIIKYISELDDGGIRTFADNVYEKILDPEYGITEAEKSTTGTNSVSVDDGYYLIAEETQAGAENTVASLVMLGTLGKNDIEVETKEEAPSSQKKVKDVNDSDATVDDGGWYDSADYDIHDQVPFQLKGTMPNNLDKYDTYKVIFHDTESAGLTFNSSSVNVYVGESTDPIAKGLYSVNTSTKDGCTFEIEIPDVKKIEGVRNGTVIRVEYTSELNDNAVIGAGGNPNEMYMEYTNNAYTDGLGKTPKDKVTVFTFKLDVHKVDGTDVEEGEEMPPLTGAAFTLFKKVKDEAFEGRTDNPYDAEKNPDGNWIASDDVYILKAIKRYTVDEANPKAEFTFEGLDDGIYKLIETTVPDGYNKADDVDFTVEAEHDEVADNPELKSLKATPDTANITVKADKSLDTTIVNRTGVQLPSTGGIGTTLFYVIGGLLVAGAAVILFTKKRVDSSDK